MGKHYLPIHPFCRYFKEPVMDVVLKAIANPETLRSQCLIVPILSEGKLSKAAKRLDKTNEGIIRSLVKRGDIEGKLNEIVLIPSVNGINAERILLLGCGRGKKLSAGECRKLLTAALNTLTQNKITDATLFLEDISVIGKDSAWIAGQLALIGGNKNYRYTRTLSQPKKSSPVKRITVACQPDKALRRAVVEGKAIANGANVAKELGNLPGNICTPTYLANEAKTLARKYKTLSTSIIDEKKMAELGMGSLLSVTAGTDQPAKLIVMEYKGAASGQKPHALVGKGITFDSGGISLKPGAKMDEMKYDMCGAASVIGTMAAITEMKLPLNVVAIIAAAENLPGGSATKPGDVVTSMSGQTIEVLNTDAEGRLVLCDALTYAERFKPQSVIDVATLTGAVIVALGRHASALYSNSDDFAAQLMAAGEDSGDRAWHMPMWDEYQPQLDSKFADIANIGGPEGGSITAACFLSRFAKKMRWAHLDVAGTAFNGGANKGATGRPVGLLTQYLINQSQSV
jgi:leucyl aminopeptidase